MKTTAQLCSSVALTICVAAMFASLGLAADVPTPPPTSETDEGHLPFVGILPQEGFTDVKECWSSLQSIEGCVVEIYQSFLAGKIQPLGPACCKAIVAVNGACWPKMFPFNPFFPPLLKSFCAIGGAAASPPTPTPAVLIYY